MKDTQNQFKKVVEQCTEIFTKKMMDYGVAWRIMRTTSVTDQIFIKANRIRSLQTKAERLVNEGIEPEFIGIINYSAMAIIQLRLGVVDKPDLEPQKAAELYSGVLQEAYDLMQCKNHDYDEAWRSMRVSSMTDLILMKLLRIKEIEYHEQRSAERSEARQEIQHQTNTHDEFSHYHRYGKRQRQIIKPLDIVCNEIVEHFVFSSKRINAFGETAKDKERSYQDTAQRQS